jgi:hypothetical protein
VQPTNSTRMLRQASLLLSSATIAVSLATSCELFARTLKMQHELTPRFSGTDDLHAPAVWYR